MKNGYLIILALIGFHFVSQAQVLEVTEVEEVIMEESNYEPEPIDKSFDKVFEKNGKYGFKNKDGVISIPPVYDTIVSKYNRIYTDYVVASKGWKYGVIDKQNKQIVPFIYDQINGYLTRLLVTIGDKMGVLSIENETIIPVEYESIKISSSGHYIVEKEGKKGLVNKENSVLIPIVHYSLKSLYNSPYCVVGNAVGKIGLINSSNKLLLAQEYDEIEVKREKFILVKKENKVGVFTKRLESILPVAYDYMKIQRGYLDYSIIAGIDGKFQVFDKEGHSLHNDQFDFITECGKQYYCTELNGKKGLLDKNGALVLENEFIHISPFTFAKQPHRLFVKKDNLYALYDEKGKVLTQELFDRIEYTGSIKFFKAQKGEKWGLIDMEGKPIGDFKYDYISQSQSYIYGVLDTNKVILGRY